MDISNLLIKFKKRNKSHHGLRFMELFPVIPDSFGLRAF
jgi:hypothetical protein